MSEVRLIDANALKYKNLAEVNGRLTYVLTAEEIDNAPTVEICANCEDRQQAEYIRHGNSWNELQALRKFKAENERPQGEWITTRTMIHDGDPYCSICDEENIIRSNFCPNCGAQMMRGEKE